MSKLTTFSLTLLSTLVISACSGGGNSSHNTTQAPLPKVNHQQPKTKIEEKAQPKVEEKAQPKLEEKTQPKLEEKAQPKVEEKAQPKVEEKAQPKVEEKAQPKVEEKVLPKVEENTQPKVEEKALPKVEEKPQPKVEEKVQPKVEENAPPKVEEKPQPKTEEQLPPNVEEMAEPSLKNEPRPPMTDSEIFKNLNPYGSDYSGSRLVTLNLDGTEIKLSPIQDNTHINHNAIELLRDRNGKLIGYHGYASVTTESPQYIGSSELVAKYAFVPLLDIDKNAKAVEPTQNVQYYGRMYYHYVETPAEISGANVVASYNNQNKRFAMQISNENGTWELRENVTKRDVPLQTDIDSQENIIGQLYIENRPKGQFIGGIFGNEGEILVGKAQSQEEQGKDAWKGVVSAIAKEKE